MSNDNLIKKHFFPNLSQTLLLILCLIPLFVVSGIVMKIMEAGNVDKSVTNLILYAICIGALAAIALIWKYKSGDKPLIYYENKVSVWIYVMLIPALLGLSLCVDSIGTMFLPDIPDYMIEFLQNAANINLPTILTVVVLAPILEEIICRGIICEGLIKNISPRVGILLSAFIFALMHLNPWQALPAFCVGCFLGWIYWKTRSLLPCIFIHFVNNATSVYMYHLYSNSGYDVETTPADFCGINQISIIIIGAAIFLASFWAIKQKLKTEVIRIKKCYVERS